MMCEAGIFLRRRKEFFKKKRKCDIASTHVIINEKDRRFKICLKCWRKICDSGVEW